MTRSTRASDALAGARASPRNFRCSSPRSSANAVDNSARSRELVVQPGAPGAANRRGQVQGGLRHCETIIDVQPWAPRPKGLLGPPWRPICPGRPGHNQTRANLPRRKFRCSASRPNQRSARSRAATEGGTGATRAIERPCRRPGFGLPGWPLSFCKPVDHRRGTVTSVCTSPVVRCAGTSVCRGPQIRDSRWPGERADESPRAKLRPDGFAGYP